MVRKVVKIILILVIFGTVAGLSAYLALTFIIKSEKTVIVPELAGKEVVYALSVLSGLGLNTKISATENHPTIPKDHVIFQEPGPGAEIKKGRDVYLVVSKGQSSLMIPTFDGMPLEKARIVIEQKGFCVGVISRAYNQAVATDHIFAQNPPPKTALAAGSCIDLLVSRGPRPTYYKMPRLSGLTLQTGLIAIENQQLILGKIITAWDNRHPMQTIIKQEPAAGSRVAVGQAVNLVVNRRKTDSMPEIPTVHRGVGLMRYRVASGFLRRHVKLNWKAFDIDTNLFDEFIAPGSEIWFLIPRGNMSKAALYVDNILVTTEFFE